MAFVEKTGKTVEDAVAEALKELNITADEANIEVLEEGKKGVFGFFSKDAKVRVSVKEAVTEVKEEAQKTKSFTEAKDEALAAIKSAAEIAKDTVKADVETTKKELKEKAEAAKADAEAKKQELKEKVEAAKADAAVKVEEIKTKAAKAKEEAVDDAIEKLQSVKGDKADKAAREPRHYAVNDEAIEAAREFLKKIFAAMKIEVSMEKFVNKNDGSVTLKLHGDDMGILIGKHGQTLDSLQYLTNLVANKNSSERVRVLIDVEDYRDRRVETLTRLANRLADKVKRSGERVALEPMNPHERKIIHMALQNDRKVTTLSEGDDPYRHVVIELKK